MIIAVASGKGGTGKTTFSVNMAYALAETEKVRLLDCDVEEPNDNLFVKAEITQTEPVKVSKPGWDSEKCTACGKCAERCRYNAIVLAKKQVLVFGDMCHSCGVCTYVCPEGAMPEVDYEVGVVESAPENKGFYFAQGRLNIGESLAPTVVKGVKKHLDSGAVNIIDAPPGTSCPVVEAVNGVDVAVLVTEPTLFGLNDLKLAVGLVLEMRVPLGIIVNRSDGTDKLIQDYADSVRVPVVGRIPFSRDYAETYSSGDILATKFPELKENLLNIYENIKQVADLPVPEKVELEELKSSGDAKPFEPEMIGDADDYCELTVISGKGGTGKTTVTASLAVLSENKVLADCDVDAADLHLLLKPEIYEQKDFSGGKIATIDHLKCFGCGKCADACRFKAIELGGPGNDLIAQTYKIDELSCEGCGLCLQVCPASAISDHDKINGKFYVSGTVQGPMVHARLGLAEDNSGKLVSKVRGRATGIAEKGRARWILADGPPGTGCPVIASVAGTDLVLAVTEPTVSGVHDLERVLELVKHFGVKAMVVINKCDLNREMAALIKEKSASIGAEVIAEIPFDSNVNKALAAGKTVVDYGEGPAAEVMNKIWNIIKEKLG